jgi:hypothetical protein
MFGKKAFTLLCVVGVLLCGACGLFFREPPASMHHFVDMRTVRVEVSNNTATHEIDPVAMKAAVIRAINASKKRTPLRAVADGDADGTLTLDVAKEEEYLANFQSQPVDSENDAAMWRFHAVISGELKSKDGLTLWSNQNWPSWRGFSVTEMKKRTPTPGWHDAKFRSVFFTKDFVPDIASQFVYELLSQ